MHQIAPFQKFSRGSMPPLPNPGYALDILSVDTNSHITCNSDCVHQTQL